MACLKLNLQNILDNHEQYDFNVFLQLIRRFHKKNRHQVFADTGIGVKTLFYIESGMFMTRPKPPDIIILADYFDIPVSLLNEKLDKFMKEKKNKPKYYIPKKRNRKTSNSKGSKNESVAVPN